MTSAVCDVLQAVEDADEKSWTSCMRRGGTFEFPVSRELETDSQANALDGAISERRIRLWSFVASPRETLHGLVYQDLHARG
jgi:hypothetical protein